MANTQYDITLQVELAGDILTLEYGETERKLMRDGEKRKIKMFFIPPMEISSSPWVTHIVAAFLWQGLNTERIQDESAWLFQPESSTRSKQQKPCLTKRKGYFRSQTEENQRFGLLHTKHQQVEIIFFAVIDLHIFRLRLHFCFVLSDLLVWGILWHAKTCLRMMTSQDDEADKDFTVMPHYLRSSTPPLSLKLRDHVFLSGMYLHMEMCGISTMLLLRFFSTLQKVCGGVSPFPGMMTQMSVTASEACDWLSGARR